MGKKSTGAPFKYVDKVLMIMISKELSINGAVSRLSRKGRGHWKIMGSITSIHNSGVDASRAHVAPYSWSLRQKRVMNGSS